MILLWGLPGDTPMAQVLAALASAGQATFFLDERAALDTEITFSAADASEGLLRTRDASIELASVTAVYQRPYGVDRIPALAGLPPDDQTRRRAEWVSGALSGWLEITPAMVVNTPTAMASNGSKPYQAQLIEQFGLRVPATLVTTDPAAVLAFRERYGTIIYKSTSGVRSIVTKLSDTQLGRLGLVRWCPTQFQEYVAGEDHRIHVVGDEVFACRIASAADDYRYAARQGASADITACELPPGLADTCRRLALGLDLPVAGIDLRRHPDGEWYCFEVNPSPAFTYFEARSGQPIGESIARLLTGYARGADQAGLRAVALAAVADPTRPPPLQGRPTREMRRR